MNLFLRLFNDLFFYQWKRTDRTIAFSLLASALSACGGGGGTNMSHLSSSPPNGQKYSPLISHASSITFDLTGDSFIDAMTHGAKWDVPSSNRGPGDPGLAFAIANGHRGETWGDDWRTTFTNFFSELNRFSDFTGVKIVDIAKWQKSEGSDYYGYGVNNLFENPTEAYEAGATLVLSRDGSFLTESFGNNAWAIGFPPFFEIPHAGDIYINENSPANFLPPSAYNRGGDGFTLMLHELGHALGLKHPHDDGGTGRPTFEEIGMGAWDDENYTVMSYHDEFGNVVNSPSGFMVTDVVALMYLYGIRPDFTNFDYADPNNNRITHINTKEKSETITFLNINAEVYLPYTRLTDLVPLDHGYIKDINTNKISWLLGKWDDVICGNGNDFIYGNDNDNNIEAGGGNDYIECGKGNDLLHGLSGADTFVMKKGWGHNIISDFEPGTDILKVVNSLGADDNSEATYSRNSDGHAVYTLDFATSFTLFHVTSDVLI